MKLKFEIEIDTSVEQDADELKAIIEQLEVLLQLIEESKG